MKVDKKLKKKLSRVTGISNSSIKHHFYINPPDFDPVLNLGLSAGNVGPFPYFINDLEEIIFLKKETPSEFVAVRLTPFDTLIITERLFEILMVAYLRSKGREVTFIVEDEYDFAPAKSSRRKLWELYA